MRDDIPLADAINDTWSAYPRDKCLDEIFAAHAARDPAAVALAYGDEEVTYGELDERSSRLAAHILARGGAGGVIGVCIERSPEMMVAFLAILKAGGAYLPLDMDYPVDRLLYMADHVDCRLILGRAGQLSAFAASGRALMDLDGERDAVAGAPAAARVPGRRPSDLAYVMFTSGTTGNPKGVGVEHANVSRLVLNTNYVDLSPADVFLQLSSIAFDASTFEIWGALLNGGKLVLYDRPLVDVGRIEAIIARHGVSVLWLSAGLFNQVVETSAAMFAPVRQLLVGGDVLSVSHVRKAMDLNPGCQVINGYGPTECTTFSVCFRVTRESLGGPSLPIGRPIANTQAYILDEALRPVPPGEVGELHIGGEGVSRGYIGAPELTARKFVSIVQGGEARRVYRTGDLVRLGEDANIYFLGRADRQLKIRGYRVEPAEIEAALLTCCGPAVAQAVVVGIDDRRGDKRLVAYVVGPSGELPGSAALRDALRKALPAYMVPATFVCLDAIPLTTNGKVDRDRLPAPQWKPLSSSTADTPRTPLEREVAAIWAEVLGPGAGGRIGAGVAEAGGGAAELAEIAAKIRDRYAVRLDGVPDPAAATVAVLVNSLRRELSNAATKENAYERVHG
ncbi:amino acid adenylation domain-containing protein [Arenibaculum sp.]|uniref:amino acid adenylation domain-containing protein n=1 Tax=Arenibaculum sp. TaxID=2865862 RepID=UPI002E0E490A|nr:amino acid adenylation domain-containing protein [Arenibaculum sp.]